MSSNDSAELLDNLDSIHYICSISSVLVSDNIEENQRAFLLSFSCDVRRGPYTSFRVCGVR